MTDDLRAQLKEKDKIIEEIKSYMPKVGDENYHNMPRTIHKLKEQLKQKGEMLERAVEVIGFYSERGNWNKNHQVCWTTISKVDHELTTTRRLGGKSARQFLKDLEENK